MKAKLKLKQIKMRGC